MNRNTTKLKYRGLGFTLIEMVCVILLVGLAASLAAQKYTGLRKNAEITAAESDLSAIRDAFRSPGGYLDNMGNIPGFSCGLLRISNLLVSTNLFGMDGVRVDDGISRLGYAPSYAFTSWSDDGKRGWKGPYLRTSSGTCSPFPAADDRRFPGDRTFAERGFYPTLRRLRLPDLFLTSSRIRSIYGFCGEATVTDPWGNPYILQTPPPQAFPDVSSVSDDTRFRYARIVSAGPDGILSTPCYFENLTNRTFSTWSEEAKSLSRLAGMRADGQSPARGDDIVLFLGRPDIYEEYGK